MRLERSKCINKQIQTYQKKSIMHLEICLRPREHQREGQLLLLHQETRCKKQIFYDWIISYERNLLSLTLGCSNIPSRQAQVLWMCQIHHLGNEMCLINPLYLLILSILMYPMENKVFIFFKFLCVFLIYNRILI